MTFTTFTCTFNNFLQFGNLKVCIFSTLKKYIFEKKITFLWKKLYKTDTFLYVLTVEKAAVSLPTKCLGNPTSGTASGGDYTIFSPFQFQKGDMNNCFQCILTSSVSSVSAVYKFVTPVVSFNSPQELRPNLKFSTTLVVV